MERIRGVEFSKTLSEREKEDSTVVIETMLAQVEQMEAARRSLGRGERAEVFCHNDPALDSVCLKLFFPESEKPSHTAHGELAMLDRAYLARINVPQPIAAFNDEASGREGVFMARLAGVSLEDIIVRNVDLPARLASDPRELLGFYGQIKSQVERLHDEAGIQHRDLHAGNVMVTPTGEAYLIDFGNARRLLGDDDEPSTDMTSRGPYYYASDAEGMHNTWSKFLKSVTNQQDLVH